MKQKTRAAKSIASHVVPAVIDRSDGITPTELSEAGSVLRAGVTKPAETLRSTIRVRCINCGQTDYVITVEQTPPAPKQYACPVCRHAWTEADERAPFRKMYRGER